ncbi:MAG: DNA polymerase I [Oscillospiraceae bacterium]|nr:DNA polymerase I [Oscillospiraceae bacterium]
MKLMVLDGNSIANRAFYGIKLLSTRDGQFTNAVYGFLTILNRLLEEEQPEALCVTFDRKAPTFRHLAFADYKANRHGMPEELRQQMPVLKEILSAMRIPCYEMDGWEADDLIGTISRRCEAEGWDCAIVTGDKDSLQLVTEHTTVKLVTTRMGKTTTESVTPDVFFEKYGFEPKKLIDLKALMGDSSDNYPGVKGIGEKSALSLIQNYGSVAEIYAHFDEIPLKPAQRKRLDEGREEAKLSYDLATIRCDAPLDFAPGDNLRKEPENGRLYELFRRLEFHKLIEKYGLTPEMTTTTPVSASVEPTAPEEQQAVNCEIRVPESAEALEPLLNGWKASPWVTVNVLPDFSAVAIDNLVLDGVCIGVVLYRDKLGDALYQKALEALFSDQVKKVAHRVKELMNALLGEGYSTDGFLFDTALGAYLLNPTAGSYELNELFQTYCGGQLPSPKYLEENAFSPLASEADKALSEAALLSWSTACGAVYEQMLPKLEELGMMELYNTVELPLCSVLAEMERAGVLVDKDALERFGTTLSQGIDKTQREVFQSAGVEFNINSTKQLGEVLFEKLNLPSGKKTKRGYSTSAEVLEKLRGYHPVVEGVLEYRQLTKLKSTYVDGLTREIAEDGRIHTNFQNTVTATGRLSSTEPNLQNIPVRTQLGAEMRKMFIAGSGNVLVDADYSQIELRLLAHIANDANMIANYQQGGDIHAATAASIYGVPLELVSKQMRSSAKAINFGIVYGMSAYSLSEDLHISVGEAKDYMNRYFSNFSGVLKYQKDIVAEAKENGYVSTLQGRRRWLPELKSSNYPLRQFGERVALNMPIQGTAADIMKLAMIRVQNRLKAEQLTGRLVLQVHDELIVECPEAEAEQVAKLVQEEMENALALRVPLVAEAQIGQSWSDAH